MQTADSSIIYGFHQLHHPDLRLIEILYILIFLLSFKPQPLHLNHTNLKKLFKSGSAAIVFAFILSGCFGISATAQTTVTASITYQTFYDNLSPYGTWIDYPGYGNVWNPRIDGDFRPYATNGSWIYSSEGWTWASDYPWGWAPFHYGRWLYDDNYGWLWIPGYDWSPAWVTWGTVDNYYCWAPLMPEVNVIADFGSWRPHSFYWNVCSRDHIYDKNISTVIERPEHVTNVVNRITIINNFNTTHRNNLHYSRGPDVNEVQRFTKEKITAVSFREVSKANKVSHKGNTFNVYRPAVQVPQPHEFRKVENDQVKPIRANNDMPSRKRDEQKNNVEHLPVHKMPVDHSKGVNSANTSHNANNNRSGNNGKKH